LAAVIVVETVSKETGSDLQRDSFEEFEAASLFCPRCRRATPARKKLLLVLPSGNKYDYMCAECGTAVGGKTDNDPTDFYGTVSPKLRR
jgi:hypothetical protein